MALGWGEEKIRMGLLDAIVGKFFRDEKAGKIVTFPVGGRYRAYVVRSESEELKIRAFLKMFYCAELSLQLVSLLLTIGWMTELGDASINSVAHFAKSGAVFLGIYSLTVAGPYWLLLRTYKKALLSFVSAEDEVVVSGKNAGRQFWVVIVGALVLVIGSIFYLIRSK
jgi:hypothetical protein